MEFMANIIPSAIQGILLVKPEQHSKMLLDAFGGNDSLADLHGYLTKKWLMDCPDFPAEYGNTMQTLVDVSHDVLYCSLLSGFLMNCI